MSSAADFFGLQPQAPPQQTNATSFFGLQTKSDIQLTPQQMQGGQPLSVEDRDLPAEYAASQPHEAAVSPTLQNIVNPAAQAIAEGLVAPLGVIAPQTAANVERDISAPSAFPYDSNSSVAKVSKFFGGFVPSVAAAATGPLGAAAYFGLSGAGQARMTASQERTAGQDVPKWKEYADEAIQGGLGVALARIPGAKSGIVAKAVEQAFRMGAYQAASNVANKLVNPNQPAMEGVGKMAAVGAGGSLIHSALTGEFNAKPTAQPGPTVPPEAGAAAPTISGQRLGVGGEGPLAAEPAATGGTPGEIGPVGQLRDQGAEQRAGVGQPGGPVGQEGLPGGGPGQIAVPSAGRIAERQAGDPGFLPVAGQRPGEPTEVAATTGPAAVAKNAGNRVGPALSHIEDHPDSDRWDDPDFLRELNEQQNEHLMRDRAVAEAGQGKPVPRAMLERMLLDAYEPYAASPDSAERELDAAAGGGQWGMFRPDKSGRLPEEARHIIENVPGSLRFFKLAKDFGDAPKGEDAMYEMGQDRYEAAIKAIAGGRAEKLRDAVEFAENHADPNLNALAAQYHDVESRQRESRSARAGQRRSEVFQQKSKDRISAGLQSGALTPGKEQNQGIASGSESVGPKLPGNAAAPLPEVPASAERPPEQPPREGLSEPQSGVSSASPESTAMPTSFKQGLFGQYVEAQKADQVAPLFHESTEIAKPALPNSDWRDERAAKFQPETDALPGLGRQAGQAPIVQALAESPVHFANQDIKPAIQKAGMGLIQTWRGIRKIFGGQKGDAADAGKIAYRALGGELARKLDQFRDQFSKARYLIGKLSAADQLAITDAAQRGAANRPLPGKLKYGGTGEGVTLRPFEGLQPEDKGELKFGGVGVGMPHDQPAGIEVPGSGKESVAQRSATLPPHIQPIVDALRDMYMDSLKNIQRVKPDFEGIEDYMPQIWKDTAKARDFYQKWRANATGFLKNKMFPTQADGIAAGLEPMSTNPVEMAEIALRQQWKYVKSMDIKNDLTRRGLIQTMGPNRELSPGKAELPGPIFSGYQADPELAGVIRNHLMPTLGEHEALGPIYKFGMAGVNTVNEVQLGLSYFHALTTIFHRATSDLGGVGQALAAGDPVQVLRSAGLLITRPGRLIADMLPSRSRLQNAWLHPDSATPEDAFMMHLLAGAGGRAIGDEEYSNGMWKATRDAWKQGNFIGASVRAPFAVIDGVTKPIMQWMVPKAKVGIFSDVMDAQMREYARKGITPTHGQLLEHARQAWDSADNRLGQFVTDNLFWNKYATGLGHMLVRLGWNVGTVREVGGGAKDLAVGGAKLVKNVVTGNKPLDFSKPFNYTATGRAAFVAALPIASALAGGLWTYLRTGKSPKDLTDFYPPLGYMREVLSALHDPVGTVENKINPFIKNIHDLVENQTYQGDHVYSPADSYPKQAIQAAKYIAKEDQPLSFQMGGNVLHGAPKWATESAASNLAYQLRDANKRDMTPEQKQALTQRENIADQIRGDRAANIPTDQQKGLKMLQDANLPPAQRSEVLRWATEKPGIGSQVKSLPIDGAMQVWNKMNTQEKEQSRSILLGKISQSRSITADQRRQYIKQINAESPLTQPDQSETVAP